MAMEKYANILKEMGNHEFDRTSTTKEPTWVLSIQDPNNPGGYLTSSNNKLAAIGAVAINLINTAPIHEYEFCISRRFNPSSVTGLFPGSLFGHELQIAAPIGAISPNVHAVFSQNVLVPQIQLLRLATSSSRIADQPNAYIVAAYTFNQVYITGLTSQADVISLAVRYINVQYDKASVDPRTGIVNGMDAASYHNLADSTIVAAA